MACRRSVRSKMLDFLIFAAVVIVCLIVAIIYLYPVRTLVLFLSHYRHDVSFALIVSSRGSY